jgi:hypothetical protein
MELFGLYTFHSISRYETIHSAYLTSTLTVLVQNYSMLKSKLLLQQTPNKVKKNVEHDISIDHNAYVFAGGGVRDWAGRGYVLGRDARRGGAVDRPHPGCFSAPLEHVWGHFWPLVCRWIVEASTGVLTRTIAARLVGWAGHAWGLVV